MWIERKLQEILAKYQSQFPVTIITGARQVGKTSLLTMVFPHYSYHCYSINQHLKLFQNFLKKDKS